MKPRNITSQSANQFLDNHEKEWDDLVKAALVHYRKQPGKISKVHFGQLPGNTLAYDSIRIEITVQQTNQVTKLISTFKKDSILVNSTPVPGTTKPLKVGKWITRREFDELRQNKKAWNFFLGLLYQRLGAVQEDRNFSPHSVAALSTQFLNIANEIQDNQERLRFKKGTDPRSLTLKDYFPYIRSTVDLLLISPSTPTSARAWAATACSMHQPTWTRVPSGRRCPCPSALPIASAPNTSKIYSLSKELGATP